MRPVRDRYRLCDILPLNESKNHSLLFVLTVMHDMLQRSSLNVGIKIDLICDQASLC